MACASEVTLTATQVSRPTEKGVWLCTDSACSTGDPLRYHSHFTATVLATPTTPISAQELIASGRLGTAVKKAHLICGVDGAEADLQDRGPQQVGEEGSVKFHYFSLTWAGFGT